MSRLESFFQNAAGEYQHPLLDFLVSNKPDQVQVEVARPRDILGFKPTKLYIHLMQGGQKVGPKEYDWDDELNTALVRSGVTAVSEDNEKSRFALALRAGFRKAETRYGDGFFNAVLGQFVRDSEFRGFPEVADVLRDVHTNAPYMGGGGSYEDCRSLIIQEIRARAQELTTCLHYPQPAAEEILAGAVARYLDDRFTVSDRRRLGWAV
jgi:hypothetical protein